MAIDFNPSTDELVQLIINSSSKDFEIRNNDEEFGYIKFTNYCANDCLYCSYSRENWDIKRSRLSAEEIVEKAKAEYESGKKSLILYGGLDIYFYAAKLAPIIESIKKECPESELYVALEERVYEDYETFYKAGADGFILPHRSANEEHFAKIHPMDMYADFRKNVLPILKQIGLKVGTGITVGWPYQTAQILAQDIEFVREIEPDLVIIDRFLPQKDTDFEGFAKGDQKQTENVRGIVSKMLPDAKILTKLSL